MKHASKPATSSRKRDAAVVALDEGGGGATDRLRDGGAAASKKVKLSHHQGVTAAPVNAAGGHSPLHAALNSQHTAPEKIAEYAAIFKAGNPFPHLHVQNVFPETLLRRVRDELLVANYRQKRNDLYHFEQTDDLRTAQGNATAQLRDLLYGPEFREWITAVTGIETAPTVDLSAAKYTDGSYLLCHDDDLADRRIAYIVYLVPEDFDASDGGSLDLFDTRSDGQPGGIVKRLTPAWNSVAFFDVSPISFHQVAEVLNDAKGPRMSVSGWFYGKPLPRPPPMALPMPTFICPASPDGGSATSTPHDATTTVSRTSVQGVPVTVFPAASRASGVPDGRIDALEDWIAPMYLRAGVVKQMAAQVGAIPCVLLRLLYSRCSAKPFVS